MYPRGRRCVKCEYWECINNEELEKYRELAEGECRRYPPNVPSFWNTHEEQCKLTDLIVNLDKGSQFMVWPTTFADEWCGEFELTTDRDRLNSLKDWCE